MNENDTTHDQTASELPPDDFGGIQISSTIKISDPESSEILVNMRGDE